MLRMIPVGSGKMDDLKPLLRGEQKREAEKEKANE